MQTFMPFPSFTKSAKVLDDSRLRKQHVEAEQILKCLRNPNAKGWKTHPAVLQWKGYEYALELYNYAISEECKSRGFKGRATTYPAMLVMPSWIGKEEIHSSHRSRLLFKGRVDAVCSTLKKNLKVRSINDWLRMCNYPEKNVMKLKDVLRLEKISTERKLTIEPNFYAQYNWSDIDTNPYVWPVKKETVSLITNRLSHSEQTNKLLYFRHFSNHRCWF